MVRDCTGKRVAACVGLLVVAVFMHACSSSKPMPDPRATTELWGEMKPVVSVKELMRDMLDPISDNIFEAVSVVVDKNGTIVFRKLYDTSELPACSEPLGVLRN